MTQAFNLAQLANNLNTSGQLDATDGLSGAVPIANGGTGQSTATNAINALLPSQGSNSGRYLTTNGSAASWGVVNQTIVKVHYLTYSTRTSTGTGTGVVFNYGTFTPVNAATNGFMVHVNCPGRQQGQNWNGAGIRFAGSSTYDYRELGMLYTGPASFQAFNSFNFIISEGSIAQSSYTVQHYRYTVDSNMENYCPNSSDDNRLNQTVATVMIIEFKNP
jgi:hypothetical protein